MTPWIKLNILSFIFGIPIFFAVAGFSKKQFFVVLGKKAGRIISGNIFFLSSISVLLFLYFLSIAPGGSFDEFNYAMGIRDSGFYVGYNHFLSHHILAFVYSLFKNYTNDTLFVSKCLNISYTLILLILVRACILKVTSSKLLSNLGFLLLGISFGIWKYAISAEVYPLMLMFWVLAVFLSIRIQEGKNSWREFLLLGFVTNLALLTHDMAILCSIALFFSFIFSDRKNRKTYILRYIVSGILFLVILQGLAAYRCYKLDINKYINHHLHYFNYPEAGYNFSKLKNLFILIRESLYSMFVGLESKWLSYGIGSKIMTIVIYSASMAFLFYLYRLAVANFIKSTNKQRIFFRILFFNWLVLYFFAILWRPNDEIHHWFLPFTVLVLCFLLSIKKDDTFDTACFILSMLICLVFLASSGVYNFSSNKLLTSKTTIGWLDAVDNSQEYVFGEHESLMAVRYYKPKAIVTSDADFLRKSILANKKVFIPNRYIEYLKDFSVERWPVNPELFKVCLTQ